MNCLINYNNLKIMKNHFVGIIHYKWLKNNFHIYNIIKSIIMILESQLMNLLIHKNL